MVKITTGNKSYVSYIFPMINLSGKFRNFYFVPIKYHLKFVNFFVLVSFIFSIFFLGRFFVSSSEFLSYFYDIVPSSVIVSLQGFFIFFRLNWGEKREKVWSESFIVFSNLPIIIIIDIIMYPTSMMLGLIYSFKFIGSEGAFFKSLALLMLSLLLLTCISNLIYFNLFLKKQS